MKPGILAITMLAGAIVLSVMGPAPSYAAVHQVEGLSINIPDDWEVKSAFMGLSLFARPSQAQDADAWAQDHIAVSRQASSGLAAKPKDAAKILDAMAKEKISQIGHHATDFTVLGQSDIKVGSVKARKIDLQYTEGMRSIRSWCVLIPQGDKQFVSIMMASSPHRFATRSALFDNLIRNLAAANR